MLVSVGFSLIQMSSSLASPVDGGIQVRHDSPAWSPPFCIHKHDFDGGPVGNNITCARGRWTLPKTDLRVPIVLLHSGFLVWRFVPSRGQLLRMACEVPGRALCDLIAF
jgi:hypothetical protein